MCVMVLQEQHQVALQSASLGRSSCVSFGEVISSADVAGSCVALAPYGDAFFQITDARSFENYSH